MGQLQRHGRVCAYDRPYNIGLSRETGPLIIGQLHSLIPGKESPPVGDLAAELDTANFQCLWPIYGRTVVVVTMLHSLNWFGLPLTPASHTSEVAWATAPVSAIKE